MPKDEAKAMLEHRSEIRGERIESVVRFVESTCTDAWEAIGTLEIAKNIFITRAYESGRLKRTDLGEVVP